MRQPWLWRRKGWYRLTMNVAGYGADQERVSTLLPVGSIAEARQALSLVLPDVADEFLETVIVGSGADHGFTPTDAYCLVSTCPDFRINVYQMCKIGKLSFVAGAEIPKRYVS